MQIRDGTHKMCSTGTKRSEGMTQSLAMCERGIAATRQDHRLRSFRLKNAVMGTIYKALQEPFINSITTGDTWQVLQCDWHFWRPKEVAQRKLDDQRFQTPRTSVRGGVPHSTLPSGGILKKNPARRGHISRGLCFNGSTPGHFLIKESGIFLLSDQRHEVGFAGSPALQEHSHSAATYNLFFSAFGCNTKRCPLILFFCLNVGFSFHK